MYLNSQKNLDIWELINKLITEIIIMALKT